jgi:putative GTP pyrophosphokinase
MMASEDLRQQYDQLAPKLIKLKQEVIYILEQQIESTGIPIHMISGRIKTFDSLNAKADRQDIRTPLDDIDDICGVRIICLFLSDLGRLGEIVDNAFHVLRKDDKVISKAQDQFGYLSVHYVCRLPDSYVGARYDDIKEFRFEIQLRTIAMHAWATISHYLDYKSTQAIPSELRKDFHALSGLFYLADSHFELFFRSSQEARKRAEQRIEEGSDLHREEINLDTLTAFLRQKYPKRKNAEASAISELVEEILATGYTSLAEVDSDLAKAAKVFEYYENHFLPWSARSYSDAGVVRASLSLVNDRYLLNRNIKPSNAMLKNYEEARKKTQ